MKQAWITGCGAKTSLFDSLSELKDRSIGSFPILQPRDFDKILASNCRFASKSAIAREDRSVLNEVAKLAIDTASEAFSSAEKTQLISTDLKKDCSIYIASELMAPFNMETMGRFLSKNSQNDDEFDWACLGKIKNDLNPLDMLRLLSTNPLYHLSKFFSLHGGGYPIRRMSLSSLCALHAAFYNLSNNLPISLVSAVGDLTSSINLLAFKKMGVIKNDNNNRGIIPSFGSASLILESDTSLQQRPNTIKYAEILDIKTHFSPLPPSVEIWSQLFKITKRHRVDQLYIVTYANGVTELTETENKAIRKTFPNASVINYKQHIGYTGKANNLIDLVLALSDERIIPGSHVLLNGVGMSVGAGCILIRKLLNAK